MLSAQDRTVDSLKLAFKNAKHDTVKCEILEYLIDLEQENDPWLTYNIELLKIAEKNIAKTSGNERNLFLRCKADALYNIAFLDDLNGNTKEALNKNLRALKIYETLGRKKDMAPTINNIGAIYSRAGNFDKALEYYEKAVKLSEEAGDKKAIGYFLNNIGGLYDNHGYVAKALEYYYRSLKSNEQCKDSISIATVLTNIGMVYKNQGDVPKALENFRKALLIQESINDKKGRALSLNNIGLVYSLNNDFEKALQFNLQALKLREQIKDVRGIAGSLGNIGAIYKHKGDLKKSLDYLNRSRELIEKANDKRGISLSLNGIANVLVDMNRTVEALSLAKQSYSIANNLKYPDLISKSALTLKRIYEKQHQYQQAFEMFEVYNQMRDSINNTETKTASIKKQFQYHYEKKALEDSVRNTEEQKVKNAMLHAQEAQLKQEKTQRIALYGGLVLVVAFLGFVFNRFRATQKQKMIIEQQKVMVDQAFAHLEEKNKEVLDSIHYAKRIQTALLPSEKYIERKLNELN
ncbi:MAG: tetratricopeptide repeat protein [Bacteroidota bacterium]